MKTTITRLVRAHQCSPLAAPFDLRSVKELGGILEVGFAVPKQVAASHENHTIGQEHNSCALVTLYVQTSGKLESSLGRVVQFGGDRGVAACYQDVAARQQRCYLLL